MAPRISAVLNTLNEEARLPYALRSVRPWVDEIVVVDMHSDDRTAAIAREHGATVHLHPRAGFVEPARAFAVGRASGDWILVLDADEIIPGPLARRLRAAAEGGEADALRLPRLNYIFGRPVLHGGWGPAEDRQLRFFRRGAVVFPQAIHGAVAPGAGARVLDLAWAPGLAIVHFNYLDVDDFVARLNRYTGIEAGAEAARSRVASDLFRAAREVGFRYLRRGGFRDGWRGLYLALAMGFYRLTAAAKRREHLAGGGRDAAARRYREIAEELLREAGEAERAPRR